MTTRQYDQPNARQVWLVAVLGALLALVVAWQTGVPLHPASLELVPFVAGVGVAAAVALAMHGTGPGNRIRWFLANTNWGQFFLLVAVVLLLYAFSRVHDVTWAAELASALLGASAGSLARLAVID